MVKLTIKRITYWLFLQITRLIILFFVYLKIFNGRKDSSFRKKSMHITAHPSSVVGFTSIHQILPVPQPQFFARGHPERTGQNWHDKLRREWVVSRNPEPLCRRSRTKLVYGEKYVVGRICYHHVYFRSSTAPVRPANIRFLVTGHVTVQVNQLQGSQFATWWNKEPTKLIIFCSKAHWSVTIIAPGS